MDAVAKLRQILSAIPPAQLSMALEALAFVQVEQHLEKNPFPAGMTEGERNKLRSLLIAQVMAQAVNLAAEVAIGVDNAHRNADDIAAAAIAKASGKLQ